MGDEAIERLLGELRALHDKLDALERRMAALEARLAPPGEGAPPLARPVSGSWPTAPGPSGDGSGEDAFGPRVLRCRAGGHQRAVRRALAMLDDARGATAAGAGPAADVAGPGRTPDAGTIRTLQALQRIRAMQGAGAALAQTGPRERDGTPRGRTDAPGGDAPAPPAPAAETPPAPAPTAAGKEAGVDLDGALPIDLDRAPARPRKAPVPRRRRSARTARDRRGR